MKNITRLILSFLIITLAHGALAAKPLNVIVFLVDDMGWMDLSVQGSDYYRTPNVDRLAKEGMRFTDAYAACAVCSPTRAAVQTGRYPGRTGVTDWIRSRFQRGGMGTPDKNPTQWVGGKNRKLLCPPNPFWLESEEVTIAELLGARGFKSAHIGKWHLGDEAWYPTGQGYTKNFGGCDYGQPPNYFDPFNNPRHRHQMIRDGIPNLPGRKKGQFLTHREAEEAVELIKGWKDEPFFLHIANYAVHTPIQALDSVTAKYRKDGKQETNAKYAAMVESVDDCVGSVLKTLDELKLTDNTLIIFTSDNGGLDNKGRPTENAPLRSGKGYAYEGGIRVPFIVRWPGVVPTGTVSDHPITSVDILPTIMEATGTKIPAGHAIDGTSLVAHLKSGGKRALKRDELFWHFPHYRHAPGPYSIIRKGDYKLIKFYEGINELYDLKNDLGETKNLANEMPAKVKALDKRLMAGLKRMGAKIPKLNPEFKKR
ncbi:MAG: sulfatase [Verrucomicrobiia bacterium]|jgi:arylsulfatase A